MRSDSNWLVYRTPPLARDWMTLRSMLSCVRLAPFLSTPQKIPAEWDFSLERLDDAYAIVHRSFGHLRVRRELPPWQAAEHRRCPHRGNCRDFQPRCMPQPGLRSLPSALELRSAKPSHCLVCRLRLRSKPYNFDHMSRSQTA